MVRADDRSGWELTTDRARRLLSAVAGAVAVIDADGRIRWTADPLDSPGAFHDLLHPDDRADFDAQLRASHGAGRSNNRFRFRTEGGYALTRIELIDLRNDSLIGALVVVAEPGAVPATSERHRHDELTGLLTKESLLDEMRAALSTHRVGLRRPALLYVDLDEFKPVNDSLGHDAGDEVLQAIAGRLLHTTRPGDVVARVGGDEFALLLPDVVDVADAVAVAAKLVERLAEPVGLGPGRTAVIGASIGVVLAAGSDESAERLLFRADAAMFRAKGAGRGRVEVWDDTIPDLVAVHRIIEQTLPAALANDELGVTLSPVRDAHTGEAVANEAILEWDHPRLGRLRGSAWMPATIADWARSRVDALVIASACRNAAIGLPVWLRMTSGQLRSSRFLTELARGVAANGLDPGQLVISVPVDLLTGAGRTPVDLDEVAAVGARLAGDDVNGTNLPLRPMTARRFTAMRVTPELLEPDSVALLEAISGVASATGMRLVR